MKDVRRLMLTGWAVILLSSCAGQVEIRSPLPTDITSPRPPESGLPEQIAAFVGVWAGKWDRFVNRHLAGTVGEDIALVVESIMPLTDDSYQAALVYSWGISPVDKWVSPGFTRTTGTIGKEGVLRIGPDRRGFVMTYTLAENRQTLQAEAHGIGSRVDTLSFTLSGVLWRTKLP